MAKNIAVVICLLLLLASCSKDTEDKLMGKWQLKEVVDPQGDIQRVDTVWYNFQTSIFMYLIYEPSSGEYAYRRSYGYNRVEEDNRLWIQLISDPQPVNEFLEYTDWSSAQQTFIIEKLSRKDLILSSDNKQYIFRKF